MKQTKQITAIILTCDRPSRCRDSVLANGKALHGLDAEILVINNGRMEVELPEKVTNIPIRVKAMPRNMGVQARNIALTESSGSFFIFLDDDAYVQAHHVEAMLCAFRDNAQTGVVSFRIFNGPQEEASLLPTVFHGCAVGIRRTALEQVGGYPKGYMYYAEEYHLTFAIMQAGYQIAFIDSPPPVQHVRDASGRSKEHIIYRLIRNNARLFTAFLPWAAWGSAMQDMLQRYRLVAIKEHALGGYRRALLTLPASIIRGLCERNALDPELFGRIALKRQLAQAIQQSTKEYAVVLCGTGRFPSYWKHQIERSKGTVCAFLDTNPCWKGAKIGKTCVFQTVEELPPGPMVFLTGLSSFVETIHWENVLHEKGFVEEKTENTALRAEKDTAKMSSDLCHRCEIRVFLRE